MLRLRAISLCNRDFLPCVHMSFGACARVWNEPIKSVKKQPFLIHPLHFAQQMHRPTMHCASLQKLERGRWANTNLPCWHDETYYSESTLVSRPQEDICHVGLAQLHCNPQVATVHANCDDVKTYTQSTTYMVLKDRHGACWRAERPRIGCAWAPWSTHFLLTSLLGGFILNTVSVLLKRQLHYLCANTPRNDIYGYDKPESLALKSERAKRIVELSYTC